MKILLVDDEADIRKSLSHFIKKLGHTVRCAEDGQQGIEMFNTGIYDMVITDMRMPGMDGIELMGRIMEVRRSVVDVIVITGHGDMENAIKALRLGAYDYLQKPIDVRELAIVINRSVKYANLREKYAQLRNACDQEIELKTRSLRVAAEHYREAYFKEVGLGDMQIYSEEMRRVIDIAEKYSSDRNVPVLIEGESGTGKELVARRIHHSGIESAALPFVAINCGAISNELVESELFGHEGGAYTGATNKGRMGKLESAGGGTVFFDEIGEMPLPLQVKLLRVLESRKLYRVGGTREIQIDVRVISATNKDLDRAVAEGQFRLDLFHRINMGVIRIPPLRERPDDIVPMACFFAGGAFARRGKRFEGFSAEAEGWLKTCRWPGNVRQLKNTMERASLFCDRSRLSTKDLKALTSPVVGDSLAGPVMTPILGRDSFDLPETGLKLDAVMNTIIGQALEKNADNRTRTAQFLGISRRVLQGRLKKMDQ